ncbi:MAG: DUF4270 domain-containing protein [Bacteroidota bacterium]|nr:DUF4270 domain-containing protein [Bacteroidota bacterium]
MRFNPSCFYYPVLSRYFSGTKFFLIAAIVLLASCKKESPLGSDIQPDGDLINLQYTDSLTLRSITVKEDSIRSDESGIVQIGDMNDPFLGNTKASLFTQLVIPNNLLGVEFDSLTVPAVLDSCTLNLRYDFEYYGDTLQDQQFNVYQLTEDLQYDSTYYSNQVKQCYPTYASRVPVGGALITPHPRTNTIIGADTTVPLLRLPINYNFAQSIFAEGRPGGAFRTPADFLQFMKGIYIDATTPSGTGSLLRFNLADTSTKFIFYYHVGTAIKTFSLVINSTTAYFSNYKHNFTSATMGDLNFQLANPSVYSSNATYVSGAAGVKTKIEFPYLEELRNLGYTIAINKAELVFKADPTTVDGTFPINKQLYVVSIDSAGRQILLPDMFESASYFGGSANTTANEYRINIARYFQQLMEGSKPNNGLFLKEFDANGQGRRAVLGSGRNDASNNYKMYIHLVYTRIN